MKETIQNYLRSIERDRDIKILLACETGSRAWGFPSPDSDYDVRMIYVHRKNWYLSLNERRDSINLMLDDNEIDISGWDLRKSLRLLAKSNPPLLERIQSPIIYMRDDAFAMEILRQAKCCYSRIATMHHYLSLAKKCYADVSEESDYKLKRFFYGLRSAIACKWILEKDEIPPIEFDKMRQGLVLDQTIEDAIVNLIAFKSTVDESYRHHGETELLDYMNSTIDEVNEQANTLPGSKGSLDDLNAFFIRTLNANDD